MLSAGSERFGGILKRGKVQVWRDLFFAWGDVRASWIICGIKDSLVDLLIPFLSFLARIVGEFLELFQIQTDSICQICEFKWEKIRIRQTHHRNACGL